MERLWPPAPGHTTGKGRCGCGMSRRGNSNELSPTRTWARYRCRGTAPSRFYPMEQRWPRRRACQQGRPGDNDARMTGVLHLKRRLQRRALLIHGGHRLLRLVRMLGLEIIPLVMLAAGKSNPSSWSWQDSYAEVDAK